MLSESEITRRRDKIASASESTAACLRRLLLAPDQIAPEHFEIVAGFFDDCSRDLRLLAREIAADESGVVKG